MQELEHVFRVEEEKRKDDLLAVLSDRYCRAIIDSLVFKPKSAMDIAVETGIPISTVYRRIQTLYEAKLLGTSGTITDDGKKLFLYKSKIKGIKSTFHAGNVQVELIANK